MFVIGDKAKQNFIQVTRTVNIIVKQTPLEQATIIKDGIKNAEEILNMVKDTIDINDLTIYKLDIKNNADEILRLQTEISNLGWDVETKRTRDGWGNNYGFSIWLKRSDWHGKWTYSLTGHQVVFHEHTNNANDYDAVLEAVRKVTDRAKKAWVDFPTSIPFQTATNEVKRDLMVYKWEDGRDIESKSTTPTYG